MAIGPKIDLRIAGVAIFRWYMIALMILGIVAAAANSQIYVVPTYASTNGSPDPDTAPPPRP